MIQNAAQPSPGKILVIKLSALGDFIQTLGPMRAIRNHHPDAHITLLTTAPYKNFAQDCGYFDDIWIDTRPRWHNILAWLSLKKRLNAGQFSRLYDLQNNDRTRLYSKLFKTKNKPEWIGDSAPKTDHAFKRHTRMLAKAGIKNIEIDRLEWMDADIAHIPLKSPYVLLVPGCAPQHPYKRWPAAHYSALANMLATRGYQPVLIGTKAEAEVTIEIAKRCPNALDLTGQTSLAQITALARKAAAAIGNDTGPMHLIGATSCPSLALFSAHSDPARHAPNGEHVQALQEADLENLTPETVLKHFKPREDKPAQSKIKH